jgi:hypothetical protein
MPGTGNVRAEEEKTPQILLFTTYKESAQRPNFCRRDAPGPDERFCRRIRPADDVFGTHSGENSGLVPAAKMVGIKTVIP